MPYTKLIVITALLANYSSAQEIIDPFSDPTVIQNPSSITYIEDNENLDSSQDINPFNEADNFNDSPASDIIDPFKNPELIQKNTQNSEAVVIEEEPTPSQEYQAEVYDTPTENTPLDKNTPSYQRATNQEVLDAQALPSSSNDSQSYNSVAPDIQGKYRLIQGANLNVNKRIEEGYLVIEKLDETNFGYYYTFSLEKSTPSTFFGIFNYDKGKFHQRVIKNEGSLITENLTNTKIVTDGSKLELEVNIEGGSVNILWKYDLEEVAPFKLQKSLKEAKQHYKEIYKDKFSQLTY
ncbi:MAG: hypothetical protein KAG56_04105 [Sulfurovaceae bacterium]|nr:hypothetical protein [Sulfurovaceae bacterium]